MKRALVILALVVCAVEGVSCRRSDVRVIHVYVPGMKNRKCAEIILNALGKEQGIGARSVSVDMADRVVTVRYDSIQRSIKNIEFTIADAGFAANEVPANAEAAQALPPECR
jgi:copper chaperone CopZ